jgi:hypothetical protein
MILRLAVAGGRARIAVMAGGVAVGVVLLLISLTAMPALQGRIDRYAWHRTTAATPATAPDRALWLPTTDRYAGRNLIRIHIAALGPNPPVPPGIDRLPGPGEVVVSPALAELFRTVPGDQLRDRFPGRVVATIRPDGLVSPRELVGIVGRTPQELRTTVGAYPISGFEVPGEPVDLGPVLRAAIALIAVLVVGPVLVFVALVTRIGAARREQRLAAIRLAGATRGQTALLASAETAVAAVLGSLLGLAGYLVLRPVVADHFRYEGLPFPRPDVAAPLWQAALVLVVVPLIAVGTTLVALHKVQITPLGVRRRVRPRPPQLWRLAPLAAGIAGMLMLARSDPETSGPALGIAAPLSLLVGLVTAGPWVCRWLAVGLARLSRHATVLIAARRIAADPYTAFRAVSGVALAVFAATVVSTVAVGERAEPSRSPRPGVLEIDLRGVPAGTLGALDVVERRDDTLVIRADGGPAAEERLRTRVAIATPYALARTPADLRRTVAAEGWATGMRLAMIFVLIVAAAGLAVAAVTGLMERRRPFALLRAAGVRLGTLRAVTLLETGVPLVVTVVGGFAIAMLVQFLSVPRAEWLLPGPVFFASVLAGVGLALLVPLATWPLLDAGTRPETIRFE